MCECPQFSEHTQSFVSDYSGDSGYYPRRLLHDMLRRFERESELLVEQLEHPRNDPRLSGPGQNPTDLRSLRLH